MPERWQGGNRADLRAPERWQGGNRADLRAPERWQEGSQADLRAPERWQGENQADLQVPARLHLLQAQNWAGLAEVVGHRQREVLGLEPRPPQVQ